MEDSGSRAAALRSLLVPIAQLAGARVLLRHPGRLLTLLVAGLASAAVAAQEAALPNRPGSLKFAVLGDNGTGDRPQYELAEQMARAHATFPFDLVIMLGDNLLGGQRAADFVKKFELPYAPLLSAGVRFQAALGNHDRPENAAYKLWNMNGERYYSFVRGNVRFFALDSNRMDAKQVAWIETSLREAPEEWKILLPSSTVFERQPPRLRGRPAGAAGADLRQARREHGVCGPRSRLRAAEASKRNRPCRLGSRWKAAARRREADRADRGVLQSRSELPAGRDRGVDSALPGRLAHGQDGRFRYHRKTATVSGTGVWGATSHSPATT